jgi:post-segregation antitoxin (ccd killing protein)
MDAEKVSTKVVLESDVLVKERDLCEICRKCYLAVIPYVLHKVWIISMTLEHDTVVSAKIPRKLKEELQRSDINMSEAIRSGLENALKERKIEQLEELLQRVDLRRLSDQQIVRDIRTGRERKSTHQKNSSSLRTDR